MEVGDSGVDGLLEGVLLRAAGATGSPYSEVIGIKRMVDTGDGIQETGEVEEGDVKE